MTFFDHGKNPSTIMIFAGYSGSVDCSPFLRISCVVIQSSDAKCGVVRSCSARQAERAGKKNSSLSCSALRAPISNNHEPARHQHSTGQQSRDDETTTQTPIELIAACVKPLRAAGRAILSCIPIFEISGQVVCIPSGYVFMCFLLLLRHYDDFVIYKDVRLATASAV
jgi:hypothetical protein